MTAPTAVRLTQQLEEVAAVDLTGDAEAPVAALVVDGEVVDGVDIFLPMKGQVSIPEATAEIVEALDRLTTAIEASAIGGTVTIDDTDLPVLVAALGAAIETAQDLADATEAALTPRAWTTLLPDPTTDFTGAGWYDTNTTLGIPGLRWRRHHGQQIEVEGNACYLDGSGDPATPSSLDVVVAAPEEPTGQVGAIVVTSSTAGADAEFGVGTIGTDITTSIAPSGALTRFFSTLYDPAP